MTSLGLSWQNGRKQEASPERKCEHRAGSILDLGAPIEGAFDSILQLTEIFRQLAAG
jgi:hypothetical protein